MFAGNSDGCGRGKRAARIMIGPITLDPTESVGAVNESIIAGLTGDYEFVRHISVRTCEARRARLNFGNLFNFIKHLGSWLKCLAGGGIDVAHYSITSGWNLEKSLFLLSVAHLWGTKTVGHLHGGLFIQHWRRLGAVRRWLALQQLRRLDALVLLSEGWESAVRRELQLPQQMLFVVNNPVDREFEESALQMVIERDGTNVLCFGVMERMKGVIDIIDAAGLVPPDVSVRFQLVGPERERGIFEEVSHLIKKLNLSARVELFGPVVGREKRDLFERAGMFLLPSYAENFSLTILEAAAAGLPIITTPVGATCEFFEPGASVILVDPGRPEQIAAAVADLVRSSRKRVLLGAEARRVFVSKLSRDRIMRSMSAVYRNTLGV